MPVVNGRHFLTGEAVQLTWTEDRFTECQPIDGRSLSDRDIELSAWLAPGLFDLQVNGCSGIDFTSLELSPAGVERVGRELAQRGTTRFLATVTTAPLDVMEHSLRVLRQVREAGPAWLQHMVAGIHLEGPFISPDDGPRGAHPRPYCRLPAIDLLAQWQDISGRAIRIVTLAPELPGSLPVIAELTRQGVLVALGHTQATRAQIDEAVEVGARMSTHLGNGAHAILPRHPNYLWDQLGEDRLLASLIVDGHHLPESVVRTILRTKEPARCLLVSDLTGLAGLTPGCYDRTGLGSVEILDDGRLVVAGQRQYLAGATRHLIENVELLSNLGELAWPIAWQLASSAPRRALGLAWQQLAANEEVDLVEFEMGSDWNPPTASQPASAIDRPSHQVKSAPAFQARRPTWPSPTRWQVLRTWIQGHLVHDASAVSSSGLMH